MTAYVIKFQNGTYYAGYGKNDAKTLLGAQLYQSEKKAKYIMEKTSNFHHRRNEKARIIPIQMREIEQYGTTGTVYIDEFELYNAIENNSYKPIVCGNNSKPPKCTSAERERHDKSRSD